MAGVAKRALALEVMERWARDGVREFGGRNRGPVVEMIQRADLLLKPDIGYAWCQSAANAAWRLATGGFVDVDGNIRGGEYLAEGTASVGLAVEWAGREGFIVSRPFRGDHFAMQLNADRWPDHMGMIRRVLSLGRLGFLCQTVEANTSSGEAGSQDDGDGVWPRVRFLSHKRTVFYRVPGSVKRAVPTTVLRARKGWFAWFAWYEGEGDWKPYGPRRGVARPNVSKRIPVGWWLRRKLFLAARRKK